MIPVILRGTKKNTDFEIPIEMDNIQREKFEKLLKDCNFSPVEFIEVQSFARERLNPDRVQWIHTISKNEMFEILGMDLETQHFQGRLGRSEMGEITKGRLISGYMNWIREKGYDIREYKKPELRWQYIEECEAENIKRNEERIARKEQVKQEAVKERELRIVEKNKAKMLEENKRLKREMLAPLKSWITNATSDLSKNPGNNIIRTKLENFKRDYERKEREWDQSHPEVNQVPEEQEHL